MEWNVIRTQDEADEFLELVEGLHDWFIAEASMVAGHGCSRGNATSVEEGGYAAIVRFVYDSSVASAGFSSFEMKFDEVFRLEVSPENIMPLMEASLEKTMFGWVLCNDGPLTNWEREYYVDIHANLLVRCGGDVLWRSAG